MCVSDWILLAVGWSNLKVIVGGLLYFGRTKGVVLLRKEVPISLILRLKVSMLVDGDTRVFMAVQNEQDDVSHGI